MVAQAVSVNMASIGMPTANAITAYAGADPLTPFQVRVPLVRRHTFVSEFFDRSLVL